MENDAQYRDLNNQKQNAEGELADYERANAELNDKIERLKAVKNVVTNEKSDFNEIKNSVRRIIDEGYAWKGRNYDIFSRLGSELESDNDNYYTNIDNVLDSINDEITSLENQIYQNEGFIGQLKSWINSLVNEIENLFN